MSLIDGNLDSTGTDSGESLLRTEKQGTSKIFANSAKQFCGRWYMTILYFWTFVGFLWIFNATSGTLSLAKPNSTRFTQILYSPALEALKPDIKIFQLGFDNQTTPFQGPPSPDLDARWEALYAFGMTKLTIEEARRLPNRTAMLPDQHDDVGNGRGYLIMLDVFHQLHCLNMIRKALSPSYYKSQHSARGSEDDQVGFQHIDHCIDSLRQSVMCHADVTPLVFQWAENSKRYLAKAQVRHVCRDFGAIEEWAREHAMQENVDLTIRQWEDPLDPSTWRRN